MSSINLRDFQNTLVDEIDVAWQTVPNVMAVAATGSGKTVVFSHKIKQFNGASCAIAHRQELVNQISLALARNGVYHRILAGKSTITDCIQINMRELGRSFYNPNAQCAVAGVDTIIRMNASDPWFKSVGLWVLDESHHALVSNKWGKAVAMFPNAKGLGVTATAFRSDGKGLGRHADGVFDRIVMAPSMRDIINRGFLTDYRIFAPKNDIDLINVPLSAGGDYSPEPLKAAVHKSHVVGDIVESYKKIAPGKIGITFCVDVESAVLQANAYRSAGVPAETVSAKTPSLIRSNILQSLARGDIKQVTNVDLFGEGFDLPSIEIVSMGRPTASTGLFDQQFGRALRLKDGKNVGIIVDHVGNTLRHGVPDGQRNHSLDRRERKSRSTVTAELSLRVCPECTGVYDRQLGMACPYCGHETIPSGRSAPAQVDGDLSELLPDVLAKMRGDIDAVLREPTIPYNATPEIAGAIRKRHRERIQALEYLRQAMEYWSAGKSDTPRAQREFYLTFGIDVLTAQTLKRADALILIERIYATF
jgi:superfamily II DNA or RNA helicase